MSLRGYIGTARDVHFNDKVTEHRISSVSIIYLLLIRGMNIVMLKL